MRILMVSLSFIVLCFAVQPCGSAFAEEVPLSKIKGFNCEFPISSANDWEGDAPKPVIEDGQNFAFGLDSIDTAKGTARMVVKAGTVDLNMITTPKSIHFLEITPSGNFNVTTVYDARTKDGKFKAVHSRHVTMLGGPIPSQAYGNCR